MVKRKTSARASRSTNTGVARVAGMREKCAVCGRLVGNPTLHLAHMVNTGHMVNNVFLQAIMKGVINDKTEQDR